jgi:hypothetical protein
MGEPAVVALIASTQKPGCSKFKVHCGFNSYFGLSRALCNKRLLDRHFVACGEILGGTATSPRPVNPSFDFRVPCSRLNYASGSPSLLPSVLRVGDDARRITEI